MKTSTGVTNEFVIKLLLKSLRSTATFVTKKKSHHMLNKNKFLQRINFLLVTNALISCLPYITTYKTLKPYLLKRLESQFFNPCGSLGNLVMVAGVRSIQYNIIDITVSRIRAAEPRERFF